MAEWFARKEASHTEGARTVGIIIHGAKELKRADVLTESDPYCVVRIGRANSAWDDKPRGRGRRSKVVSNSASPQWNLGLAYELPRSHASELHVRVYDSDWASDDDFLGEVTVALDAATLAKGSLSVDLKGDGAAGSLSLSVGSLKLLQEREAHRRGEPIR